MQRRALTCVPNRVGALICDAPELQLKALTTCSENMTDEVIPHFHNDLGVTVIEIGAKKFMCMGALPPQDHPHVFCDMGEDIEYVCPYCSTLYRHNPRWRLTKHAQQNANFTTLADRELSGAAISVIPAANSTGSINVASSTDRYGLLFEG